MKKNLQQGFTLIELLVVIGIIAVLAAIVLIAINPARQFAQARNAERHSETNAILNAIGQYVADNKGATVGNIDADTATDQVIGSAAGQANICATLSPTYISALPIDPKQSSPAPNDKQVNDCTQTYNTGYTINIDSNGRYVIKAPQAELGDVVILTR